MVTCDCRKNAPDPNCERPEHSTQTLTVNTPAFYEERIRLLEDGLRNLAEAKGGWVCENPDCRACKAVRKAWELLA